MAYRISFVPKKTGHPVSNEALAAVGSIMLALAECSPLGIEGANPPTADQVFGKVKHHAAQIVEFSNLRTICAPDEELKALQRGILSSLERIPMHRSAHGFIRFRDAKSCATAHTAYWGRNSDKLVVLNMDAKNFFHSVTSPVVRKALEAHGITSSITTKIIDTCMLRATPELAWAALVGLNDMAARFRMPVSPEVLRRVNHLFLHAPESWAGFLKKISFSVVQGLLQTGPGVTTMTKFLPQGAPTSPLLSNLALKIVDIRLSAMAKAFGGFYTRYADDMTVTWIAFTKGHVIDGMYRCAQEVLDEYHVQLNRSKKRVMGRGVRQDIVGYCVNAGRPTISQKFRRKVRAAIHNETVRGSENFRSKQRPPAFPGESYPGYELTVERQQAIRGKISYVGSVHPQEADGMVRQLEAALSGPMRELGDDAEHEFEINFETTDREIGGGDRGEAHLD